MPVDPDYRPLKNFTDKFPDVSGNEINGLGETAVRQPSPFFWHPPNKQTHGALQEEVIRYHRQSDAMREHFSPTPPGGRGPKPIQQAEATVKKSAAEWTTTIKELALQGEAELVGVTRMDPLYVYEGYEIKEPWIVLVGVSMPYEEISQAPASFENPTAGAIVGREYNRAARVCRSLANFILSQGYFAKAWPGPYASALSMMPAAIEAGLGTLGKHGSLINETYGSSFRLSAITTDMPLVSDKPKDIGAEDFCLKCQVCVNECPPAAISHEKQMVRGVSKYYVDFDKCIPYFGETLACGICIAVCPWSRPGVGPSLSTKMLRRRKDTEKAPDGA